VNLCAWKVEEEKLNLVYMNVASSSSSGSLIVREKELV
jgi:hypothetical protein